MIDGSGTEPRSGIISLTTDFGLADGYVGQLKGVIAGINPALTVIDVTHQVPAQQIASGGFLLAAAVAAFPIGTVHLLVVDPGVGTDRFGLLAAIDGHWLVTPDNGGWSYLARQAEAAGRPVMAWRLTERHYWRPLISSTFHGRDIFAPVAAWLASGLPASAFGERYASPLRLSLPSPRMAGTATTGQIVHIDHYGNAITDLRRLDLPAPAATCRFACGRFVALGLQPTYASVPTGSAVALIGSYGTVELAQRDASAATSWQLTVGQTVVVEGQPTSPAPSG